MRPTANWITALLVVIIVALLVLAGVGCTDEWLPARTLTPGHSATATWTPAATRSATATPAGTATATPAGTAPAATRTPTSAATLSPTPAPTRTATAVPTQSTTAWPTLSPTSAPTLTPTATSAIPAAVVRIHPPSQSAAPDQVVTVAIQVEDVTNLYGLELVLAFDAGRLEAQDADGNAGNGIQMAPGDFLNVSLGFLVRNVVDNVAGQAQYVLALAAPAAPASGSGTLVQVAFRTRGAGEARIALSAVTLANDEAQVIPVTVVDGVVSVR